MIEQLSSMSVTGYMLTIICLLVLLGVFGQILKKAGYSRFWALLLLIPGLNVMLIWIFSFLNWPSSENA
jgi:hypothetical protein